MFSSCYTYEIEEVLENYVPLELGVVIEIGSRERD